MPESTFTNFTPAQASAYASGRGESYPLEVYDAVLNYHREHSPVHTSDSTSTSGTSASSSYKSDLLLDVGTGPGKVVFDLLPFFERAVGIDPGVQMIEAAKADVRYAELAREGRVRFEVAGAESCGDVAGIEEGSVDCVVVAMAAHWFDMDAFYASVAKALKPGGTLAMWTCSLMYAHDVLAPYVTPGNKLSRNVYRELPLPWTLATSKQSFSESTFARHDWDLDGVPSAAPLADGTPGPLLFSDETTPAELGKGFDAASMVVRWREANKARLESGEVGDCVALTVKALDNVLADRPGGSFVVAPSCSLLLMTRV